MDRVVRDFAPVTLPLKELGFVTLAFDLEVSERQILLRYYRVYRSYLQHLLGREAEVQVFALVLSWYNKHFIEIRHDTRDAFESSQEYLYSVRKASHRKSFNFILSVLLVN